MAALRGSAMVLLPQRAPCVAAGAAPPYQQLKLLNNRDGSLTAFSTLFFSLFITAKQANAAFAEVLAGSLSKPSCPPICLKVFVVKCQQCWQTRRMGILQASPLNDSFKGKSTYAPHQILFREHA